MKLFTKAFWKARTAPPAPAPVQESKREPSPAPTPPPVDIGKLKGRDKAAALLAKAMQPENMDARRAAEALAASKKETALQRLHAHAVEQGKLSSKRTRQSYFTLHRRDIDAAIKEAGANSNTWYATFLS